MNSGACGLGEIRPGGQKIVVGVILSFIILFVYEGVEETAKILVGVSKF